MEKQKGVMYLVIAVLTCLFQYSMQDCNRPANLDPNMIITPDQPTYGTWYSFAPSCVSGYDYVGPNTIYCNAGTPDYWSPDPFSGICSLSVQCARPNIPDPDVIISPNKTVYDLHDYVTFTCAGGGALEGDGGGYCTENGTWDFTAYPSCLATDNCTTPANSNGTSQYYNETSVTFSCDPGYMLAGGGNTIQSVCNNGTWTPQVICGKILSDVNCNATAMTVIFGRDLVGTNTSAGDIHFTDESCVAYDYDQFNVALFTAYDACNTTYETTNSTIKYLNTVTFYSETINGLITRQTVKQVPVSCELDRSQVLGSSFVAQVGEILSSEQGFGNYSMSLLRYTDEFFNQVVVDLVAPVTVGDPLYFAVRLEAVSGFIAFIRNCWATPSVNPNDVKSYSFLHEGCTGDDTMVLLSPYNSQTQKFRIDAFAFIDENPQVYIHCEALVCENDPGSRCAQGCLSRRKRGGQQTERGARSPPRIVSMGPIYSRRAADPLMSVETDESNIKTSASVQAPSLLTIMIVAIVGITCLLVGMATMFFFTRRSSRGRGRSQYRYQRVMDKDNGYDDDDNVD